jgi:hemerythrin-like domain-containing protein
VTASQVGELFVREHALFRSVLDELEQRMWREGEGARASLAESLRLLLPALDGHADVEGVVFRHPPDEIDSLPDTLPQIADQHRVLAALRCDILSALEQSAEECTFDRLRDLSASLTADLRQHLDTEERELWPLYQVALRKPISSFLSAHHERSVLALEAELVRSLSARPLAVPGG